MMPALPQAASSTGLQYDEIVRLVPGAATPPPPGNFSADAAAILRCPVFFMAGLYRGGKDYQVVFEQVADFSNMGAGSRSAAVTAAIEKYAAVLEKYCRSHPYNWFNFFDFWHAYS